MALFTAADVPWQPEQDKAPGGASAAGAAAGNRSAGTSHRARPAQLVRVLVGREVVLWTLLKLEQLPPKAGNRLRLPAFGGCSRGIRHLSSGLDASAAGR